MTSGANSTLLGAGVGSIIALAPRVFDRITGRKKDAADGAEVLSTGAGAVTTAALALLEQHREDADRAREAEERCLRRLEAVNARCEVLEERVRVLTDLHVGEIPG